MVAMLKEAKMTPQEYLDWEEKQPIKYEYMGGRVFAMTGGTIPHNDIAVNLTTALKNYRGVKGVKYQWQMPSWGCRKKGLFIIPM